jgi:hypothetical protein
MTTFGSDIARFISGRLSETIPPEDVLVFEFGQQTPFPEVNEWLRANGHLSPPLAAQDIDIGHFIDEMIPLNQLAEMVDIPRRESR